MIWVTPGHVYRENILSFFLLPPSVCSARSSSGQIACLLLMNTSRQGTHAASMMEASYIGEVVFGVSWWTDTHGFAGAYNTQNAVSSHFELTATS